MKLRTEIDHDDAGAYALGPDADLHHDAVSAHALMQAIADWNKLDDPQAATWVSMTLHRADELMQQWGYKNDDARK